ncbi:LysR family transcriptional regulator [Wenxinia marina]|uniref:Transcriptional regulator n=1 Tax=Wenxinia marina DSM 24838 TaxID=1123501 RepID=A0A0D0QBD5_9RHOB|nr:LysR family transcriptional regulator [Wenxinia marina]KIQ68213.1 Transcriptional regulator [Wenxinia marina DSM 24838]GGL76797.1 LysR family transcriptional regulator [Wenxinia marina]
MSFTIKQARYFVGVAEYGTVSRAAAELSISQSAVTEALKDLEARLGVRLMERRHRGMELTYHGHVFLRHAKAILTEAANAEMTLSGRDNVGTGTLALGVTSMTSGYVLSDLLSRFRRAQPGVEVTAVEDTGEYLEHLLIGGELDLALMVVPAAQDRQGLHTEILAVSPYRLWLPLGHPLTQKESIALQDLVGEPHIVLDIDEMRAEALRLMSSFADKPRVAFRTRSVEAVRSLCASGAGIALLPDLIYRPWSLEGDRIESRDVSGTLPVVQVGLVWRRGARITPSARAFLAMAQSFHAPRLR